MNRNVLIGAVLIIAGAFVLLGGGDAWGAGNLFATFWPTLFVIPFGIFMHWMYFSVTRRRGVGLLIPAGILVTAGIVCQIATLFHGWSIMWPGFIFAVAVGLFEFYWFGSRNRYLLIPINILTALSVIFFAVFSISSIFSEFLYLKPILAILCILVGVYVLFFRRRNS